MFDSLIVTIQSHVFAWRVAHLAQMALQGRVEDTFHQRRLTAAAHTSNHRHHVQWNLRIDTFQVVHASSLDNDLAVPGAMALGDGDFFFAKQVFYGVASSRASISSRTS